jgi:SdrD B-like domain
MSPLLRLPSSVRSLFGRSPETTRRRRTTARLWRSELEPLEERSVPAIISSQLPNIAGGGTSGAAPRSTISGFVFCDDNQNGVLDLDLGEHGIAGVTVRLVRGAAVAGTVQTDASGLYFFGNLVRGNYRVVEIQPPDVEQGRAHLGTINGVTRGRTIGPDRMTFFLPPGANAVDYNFSEICLTEPPGGGTSPGEEEPVPSGVEEDADCPIPDEDPAAFTVDGSVVNLTGTSGGDVFRLLQSGSQLTISFSSVNAAGAVVTQTQTFAAGAVTEVNVNGQFGNDFLVLDNGGGLLGVTVNYNGGYGTDTLRLRNGVAETQVYTAGQAEDTGSVTLNGAGGVTQTINYEDIGLIADTVAAANMQIVGNNFQQPISILDGATWGTAVTTRVTGIHRDKKVEICHHTGSASNPAVFIDVGRPALSAHQKHGDEVLSDEPPAIPIEFANKTNVSIFGGNGGDFFLFNNPNTATGLAELTIDGGNGKDVANIQAEPLNVSVDVVLVNIEERSGQQ